VCHQAGDGQYGLNLTVVEHELNGYYGGHAISAGGASTPELLTTVTLSRANGGVVQEFTVQPHTIKSGALERVGEERG
jgi:hypothetical protein